MMDIQELRSAVSKLQRKEKGNMFRTKSIASTELKCRVREKEAKIVIEEQQRIVTVSEDCEI